MRSREEQIIYLGSRLFVGNRNLTDANCEAQRHIDEAIQRGRELERAEMAADIRDAKRWRTHIRLLFKSRHHTVGQINETIRCIDAAMNAENGQ